MKGYKQLTVCERERIQRFLWCGLSLRMIASKLKRNVGTVSRELKRNTPQQKKRYNPRKASDRAEKKRACRGRTDRLKNETIRAFVRGKLILRYSPEQISALLPKTHRGECISPEAIYQYIYYQIKNGNVKRGRIDLRSYLRRARKRRMPHHARKAQKLSRRANQGRSIDERPSIVDRRSRIGDWESDTVESCDHKPGIATPVERKTGYVMIERVSDKSAGAMTTALKKRFAALPSAVKHTMTLDNGPEQRDSEAIEDATGCTVYYAHPYHSWERGTNENTNGLIRDYFPKGTDFTKVSDEELARVELALNTRPRKRLGWRTPLEVMSVALTN